MKTNKKLPIVIAILFLLILLPAVKVQAGYQSIGTGTSQEELLKTWLRGIRQMESSGQGLGLNEDINTGTLLSTTDSNNIDVHLQKNTEYGAVVLLGASDYGKQGATIGERRMDKGATTGTEKQASTTGNRYGVYELGYKDMTVGRLGDEWVAGGTTTNFDGASRYWNRYTTNDTSAITGDATKETQGWHGGSHGWLSPSAGAYEFLRGYKSSFSYESGVYSRSSSYGRAVVVVGAGF